MPFNEGHRFIKRGDDYNWRHPYDIEDGDVDCTDMSDAEFEDIVLHHKENNK